MQISTDDFLQESISKLTQREKELKYLKDLLSSIEEKIEPIKKEIKDKEIEIRGLKSVLDLNGLGDSMIITLRLGDLIDELSELSGIDKSNIKASFQTFLYTIGKNPVEKDVIWKKTRKRDS